jgi:phosphoglycolate phosphatase
MGVEQAPFLAATFPEVEPVERNRIYEQIIAYQYERVRTDGGHLYPGVKEGLNVLQEQYRLFIVSNCHEHMIDHFTRWAGIASCLTDTMAHGVNFQPKHENIRHLIRTHQLQKPVYVGDTASDAEQSRLVPLPFVFVDYGFGEAADSALRFSSFPDLVRYYSSL